MSDPTMTIDGVQVPRFLYGTAWKEDETKRLTELALEQGFRGIDTANQRRHYHEAAVGQAVRASVESGLVTRDRPVPANQVHLSAGTGSSPALRSRGTHPNPGRAVVRQFAGASGDRDDRFLPAARPHAADGLAAGRLGAWRAMETIHDSGRVRWLGVSNVTLEQLQCLCHDARVRPRFVQNRCYAAQGWDHRVREFCTANDITYQGFSLLTANREAITRPELARIAKRHGRTVAQVVFRFAVDVGMMPLTGTTNAGHMRDDVAVFDLRLTREEIKAIEELAA